MVALLLVALLQSPAQACHEAPAGLKAECAGQAVAIAEAAVTGTVYCYEFDGPGTRPACLLQPTEPGRSGRQVVEWSPRSADCNLSLPGEYLLACGSLNLAREEQRMFRYLEIAERNISEAEAPDEASALAEPRSASALANSQQAWRTYAALACDQFEEMGDLARISSLGCRIQLTRERTHTIWRHYLAAAGECDPEAPEPIMTVVDENIIRIWTSEGPMPVAEQPWCYRPPCPPSICGT